jgi:hypothetical protein
LKELPVGNILALFFRITTEKVRKNQNILKIEKFGRTE